LYALALAVATLSAEVGEQALEAWSYRWRCGTDA
jgi:hypothetical protein